MPVWPDGAHRDKVGRSQRGRSGQVIWIPTQISSRHTHIEFATPSPVLEDVTSSASLVMKYCSECGSSMSNRWVARSRETFEETGVVVDPGALDLGWIINMTAIHQVAIAFRVNVTDLPEVHPGPESLEA
jgi:hypothetical protein